MNNSRYKRGYETFRAHSSRKLFIFVGGLIVIFVAVQFIKLASVGRVGADITRIKNEQNELELENELIRTEINEMRTASYLDQVLQEDPTLTKKNLNIINSEDTQILAQNN